MPRSVAEILPFTPPGGGGGGLTPTSIKTTAYTAAANEAVRTDTSAAGFTVTLPSSPADGVVVQLEDTAETWDPNPILLVTPVGSLTTIDGFDGSAATGGLLLDKDGEAPSFRYDLNDDDWRYLGQTGLLGGGGGGGAIPVQDEGVEVLAAPTALDFRGAGVTATNVGGVARMTIPGGGAATYLFEEFEFPEERTYSLVGYSPFAGTIATLRHFTISGTCTVAIKIGGVNITGLSAVAMSSTPGTATATANNTVSIGSRVEVAFTNILVGAPVRANLTLLFA